MKISSRKRGAAASQPHGRRACALVALLALDWCAWRPQMTAAGQRPSTRELQVKAAYLYNFAKFVTWPESALPPDSALRVGIVGKDPFRPSLSAQLKSRTAQNHPFRVITSADPGAAVACHIVFLPAAQKSHLKELVHETAGKPVLTVSEIPGFTRAGGIVNFFIDQGKVRFEINVAAAKESGLKLSAQLLSLARVVSP